MLRRRFLIMVGCCALLAACGGDDGPSDEALIAQFVKDVTGKVDEAYLTRALGYVDLERAPLDVRVPQHAGVYVEARRAELVALFRSAMRRRFWQTELALRDDEVQIEGDVADVRLRLSTALGPATVAITLRKVAPATWKVARVHVDR